MWGPVNEVVGGLHANQYDLSQPDRALGLGWDTFDRNQPIEILSNLSISQSELCWPKLLKVALIRFVEIRHFDLCHACLS